MRICFIADYRSIHTMRWIRFFAERHEVHLLSLKYPKDEPSLFKPEDYERLGVKLQLFERTGLGKFAAPLRMRKAIKRMGADVLHCHYVSHSGFIGAFSGFHPLVITAWGSDVLIEPEESLVKRIQVRFAIRRADLLTCDGENTAAKIEQLGGRREAIKRVYFGVDTKRASPDRRDSSLYRDIRKGNPGRVVINIRGFAPVYDPEAFLNAIPEVLAEFPDTRFVMARESEERKRYQEMAKAKGIDGAVAFIGNIPSNDIPKYLASADIYVSTSTSDSGIAASTAEAMACGVPVISTEVGDIRIWIEDGKNGYIIPKGDSKALSDRIRSLIRNEEARSSMGKEGRRTIEERQDYDKEMSKMEGIYRQLAEGGT